MIVLPSIEEEEDGENGYERSEKNLSHNRRRRGCERSLLYCSCGWGHGRFFAGLGKPMKNPKIARDLTGLLVTEHRSWLNGNLLNMMWYNSGLLADVIWRFDSLARHYFEFSTWWRTCTGFDPRCHVQLLESAMNGWSADWMDSSIKKPGKLRRGLQWGSRLRGTHTPKHELGEVLNIWYNSGLVADVIWKFDLEVWFPT